MQCILNTIMSFTLKNLQERNSYISSNYVNSWKLKEGIREIVQNLMDAVTLRVKPNLCTLRCSNPGTIPIDCRVE